MPTQRSYRRIEDYGAIGNLHTTVLISREGSIDWCCFPQLDDASVFGGILDLHRGGRFQVRPVDSGDGDQSYVGDTNVLETVHKADGGRLSVVDFMPLVGNIEGRNDAFAPPEIHRILKAEGGDVEVEVEWSPRFDYARVAPTIHSLDHGFLATGDGMKLSLGGVDSGLSVEYDDHGPLVRGRIRLRDGEQRVIITRWNSGETGVRLDHSHDLLKQTIDTWSGWAHKEEATGCREWAGDYANLVMRSELALKLLTNADSGAFAAAATTSLPEAIGHERNWDYRYTWIRDAALTGQAFLALGHLQEAIDFLYWAERTAEGDEREKREAKLQIMYGLHGEADLDEYELPHLEGYRKSQPVRIGNGAALQTQLDIYGELISGGYELIRMGQDLEPDVWRFLKFVADQACSAWQETDHGLWEIRGEPRHYVYSKAMVWAALDRAILLHEKHGLEGSVDAWRNSRDQVARFIDEGGFDPELGAFVQYVGSKELDASNLLLPMLELLPFEDPRVQSTIDKTLEHLTVNGLVYRYKADDGLSGEEGTFGLCTFWMVDVLALSGRIDEAYEIFEGMAQRANPLGLYSEQIDPHNREFLGNFPQAFTHIGFINSSLYLAQAEGKTLPIPPPIGSDQHRREAGRTAQLA